MRQWDKQEECRTTKQNADSDTETEEDSEQSCGEWKI